jgi:ABC-type sugar transport system substrate-binding protein
MQAGLPGTPAARARTLMLGVAAAALVASGCGSSGNDGATTAASTAAADTTAANPALAEAKATVAKYSEVPQDIGVSAPLKAKPTGTVVFMRCSQPICERQSQGTEAATKAMGMRFAESPPQGFTPETVSKAWKAGLALKPSIIVAPGTPTQLYQAELKQAGDAKIPVITWSVPDAPGTVSIYGNQATALTQSQMAQFIAADSGGKGASTLYLNLAGGGVPAGLDGFKDGYAKACPDCKLTVLDIAISDLGRPTLAPGQRVRDRRSATRCSATLNAGRPRSRAMLTVPTARPLRMRGTTMQCSSPYFSSSRPCGALRWARAVGCSMASWTGKRDAIERSM